MSTVVATYAVYTLVSVGLTYWVARTLFRNGALFLRDVFDGDARLADAVNHLLVVGFWLINLGYVALALKISGSVPDARSAVESFAFKIGGVLLVLGAMHFGNLFVLSRIRRHRRLARQPAPPVPPAAMTTWGVPGGQPPRPAPRPAQ